MPEFIISDMANALSFIYSEKQILELGARLLHQLVLGAEGVEYLQKRLVCLIIIEVTAEELQ